MNDIKVPPFTDGLKEVIEATEKLANGKLICDVDDDIDEFPKRCNGTGKINFYSLTNEE